MNKKLLTALICAALMSAPLFTFGALADDAQPDQGQTLINQTEDDTDPEPDPEPDHEPDPEPHEHSFASVSKTAATCTKDGFERFECECGESYTVVLNKTGHKLVKSRTVSPTLKAKGYTVYKCSVCGEETKKDYTPMLRNINSASVSGIKKSYAYTGKAQTPAPVIKYGGEVLKKGTDYTLAYSANTKKGTAKIVINGKGKYADSRTVTFKITAADITKAKVTGLKSCKKYTGKAIKQSVKVAVNGRTLKAGTDYTVSYKNNKALGTAQLIIKGKGNYKGTLTKKFKIVRMGWFKSKAGNYYYYSNKGKKYVSGEYKIGSYYYYFSKKGIMQYGWVKVGSNYRLYDRRSGKRLTNTTADGIKINKNGNAVLNDWAKSKIATSLKAKKVLKSITNPSDSMESKRLKAFNWIISLPYKQYRLLRPIYRQQGWEMTFANDIFDYGQGCCVSQSSALAFLFREIGYTDVYVCHDTGHSWVTIGSILYDTVFAEAKSFAANYNVYPSDYRVNPVDKRYIG